MALRNRFFGFFRGNPAKRAERLEKTLHKEGSKARIECELIARDGLERASTMHGEEKAEFLRNLNQALKSRAGMAWQGGVKNDSWDGKKIKAAIAKVSQEIALLEKTRPKK